MADPTPAGGVRSEAIWTDRNGEPCAPADATHALIVEYDEDGLEIARTYMEPPEPGQPLVAEARGLGDNLDLQSYDQIGTWDIRDPQTQELIHTLEQWATFLDITLSDMPRAWYLLANGCELVSWRVAPPELRDEVYTWLTQNRPTSG